MHRTGVGAFAIKFQRFIRVPRCRLDHFDVVVVERGQIFAQHRRDRWIGLDRGDFRRWITMFKEQRGQTDVGAHVENAGIVASGIKGINTFAKQFVMRRQERCRVADPQCPPEQLNGRFGIAR